MSPEYIIVYKLMFSFSIVSILILIAENIGPRWAGLISGMPTGTAIILYFYAQENGLEFARDSVVYHMAGLLAMQACFCCYYVFGNASRRSSLFYSIAGGLLGYMLGIMVISRFAIVPFVAPMLAIVSIVTFKYLFRNIEDKDIPYIVRPTARVILSRSLITALIIIVITSVAEMVGQGWAGLLAAFPTTVFPLLIIIHLSYGKEVSFSIIKHLPDSLGGLLVYTGILYLSYPNVGIFTGIFLAMMGALGYYAVYYVVSRRHVSTAGEG